MIIKLKVSKFVINCLISIYTFNSFCNIADDNKKEGCSAIICEKWTVVLKMPNQKTSLKKLEKRMNNKI